MCKEKIFFLYVLNVQRFFIYLIRLELRQKTLVMQWCSNFVMLQAIFPVLLVKGQYMLLAVLQKLKPLSLGDDPMMFGGSQPIARVQRVGLHLGSSIWISH